MKRFSLTTGGLMLGLALVLSPIANLKAAELKILAGGAMTGPLKVSGSLVNFKIPERNGAFGPAARVGEGARISGRSRSATERRR